MTPAYRAKRGPDVNIAHTGPHVILFRHFIPIVSFILMMHKMSIQIVCKSSLIMRIIYDLQSLQRCPPFTFSHTEFFTANCLIYTVFVCVNEQAKSQRRKVQIIKPFNCLLVENKPNRHYINTFKD